ncbi:MAG: DUF4337 domain-containing protein [Hyphomicrobiaceae bacterium]
MPDVAETKPAEDNRSKWIGIYVGILATLLAICTMGGGNAAKDAARANLDAANIWNFFQAKNTRRTSFTLAADDLELTLTSNPAMPPQARAAIEAKIKAYRETAQRFTTDKATGEGLDELWAKAKAIEADRDIAARKDPYFDVSQALLQIAIVLASVALIAGTNVLLYFSFVLGGLGTLLMLNGFTLVLKLPFFG